MVENVEGDEYEVFCDSCSAYEEIKAKSSEGAVEKVKKLGWLHTPDEDLCPECRQVAHV